VCSLIQSLFLHKQKLIFENYHILYCRNCNILKMDDQNEYLENTAESLPTLLSKFFKALTRPEACCNKCKKKFKFSTKATSNLIKHLKICSPKLHLQSINFKSRHQEKSNKDNKDDCQLPIKSFFKASSCQQFVSYDVTQKALTKALLKSIVCDQLPLSIVDSQTSRNFVSTAEPRFVISRRSTIHRRSQGRPKGSWSTPNF